MCEGGPRRRRGQWLTARGRGAGKTAAACPTRGPGGGWGVNFLEGDFKAAGPERRAFGCRCRRQGRGGGRVGGRKRAAPGWSRSQLVTPQDEPQEQEADPRGQAECAAGAEGLAGLDPAQLLRELLAEPGGRGGERAGPGRARRAGIGAGAGHGGRASGPGPGTAGGHRGRRRGRAWERRAGVGAGARHGGPRALWTSPGPWPPAPPALSAAPRIPMGSPAPRGGRGQGGPDSRAGLLPPGQLEAHAFGALNKKACRHLTPLGGGTLGDPQVGDAKPPSLVGWRWVRRASTHAGPPPSRRIWLLRYVIANWPWGTPLSAARLFFF